MVDLVILADDLSGAVESAAAASVCTRHARIAWTAQSVPPVTRVLAIDTDTRHARPDRAAAAVLAALPATGRVVKKIDSLLRGNIAAEIGALRAAGRPVILTPALPALGRTVHGGVVHLDGVPMHLAVRASGYLPDAPRSVAEALGTIPGQVVGLDTVRGGTCELTAAIGQALADGAVALCDADTDADLDAIAGASGQLDEGTVLAGSAALTAAVARRLPPDEQGVPRSAAPEPHGSGTLVVCGSSAPAIAGQLAALDPAVPVTLIDAPTLFDPTDRGAIAERVGAVWDPRSVLVVALDPQSARIEDRPSDLARALAEVVAEPATRAANLVLTGGETARRVLDRIGVRSLTPIDQAHYGAVITEAPDGQRIVIRPGSFGNNDSLSLILAALQPGRPTVSEEQR